jgi:hypothetical protein
VIRVHYLEVYGGKVTAAGKQYTSTRAVGFRLFDVAVISGHVALLAQPVQQISAWRDSGGQLYLSEQDLTAVAERDGLTLTPRLFTVDAEELPVELDKTRAFLAEHLPRTRSALDEGAPGAAGGIVLRSADRSTVAKARFQDYDRTLRRKR